MEEEEKQARQEKERIMKEKTEAKFHVISEGLKEEAEFIFSLATKVPLGTWKNVEDIKIKQSMREIKDWEDNVEKLGQRETDLIAQMADADIIPDNIPGWLNTKLAVNLAANSVKEASNESRSKDTERQ